MGVLIFRLFVTKSVLGLVVPLGYAEARKVSLLVSYTAIIENY